MNFRPAHLNRRQSDAVLDAVKDFDSSPVDHVGAVRVSRPDGSLVGYMCTVYIGGRPTHVANLLENGTVDCVDYVTEEA